MAIQGLANMFSLYFKTLDCHVTPLWLRSSQRRKKRLRYKKRRGIVCAPPLCPRWREPSFGQASAIGTAAAEIPIVRPTRQVTSNLFLSNFCVSSREGPKLMDKSFTNYTRMQKKQKPDTKVEPEGGRGDFFQCRPFDTGANLRGKDQLSRIRSWHRCEPMAPLYKLYVVYR